MTNRERFLPFIFYNKEEHSKQLFSEYKDVINEEDLRSYFTRKSETFTESNSWVVSFPPSFVALLISVPAITFSLGGTGGTSAYYVILALLVFLLIFGGLIGYAISDTRNSRKLDQLFSEYLSAKRQLKPL